MAQACLKGSGRAPALQRRVAAAGRPPAGAGGIECRWTGRSSLPNRRYALWILSSAPEIDLVIAMAGDSAAVRGDWTTPVLGH